MFKKIRFVLCVILLVSTLLLASCVDRLYGFDTEYSTGVLLTPEMIDSIIDAATLTEAELYPTETDNNGNLIVYWLPGGSVWHASKNCSSVERSADDAVIIGTITEAYLDGKDRPCKICSDNVEYEVNTDDIYTNAEATEAFPSSAEQETLKYPQDYSEEGIALVYWTKSGSVWHKSLSCPSLANTSKDNLLCGTENDAISSGKERACKKCS